MIALPLESTTKKKKKGTHTQLWASKLSCCTPVMLTNIIEKTNEYWADNRQDCKAAIRLERATGKKIYLACPQLLGEKDVLQKLFLWC